MYISITEKRREDLFLAESFIFLDKFDDGIGNLKSRIGIASRSGYVCEDDSIATL